MQYEVDGVAVMKGADLNFDQPAEFPCDECGGMVDLSSPITVHIVALDGTETEQVMSEADARALLTTISIPPPPVLCDRHGDQEIITEPWKE